MHQCSIALRTALKFPQLKAKYTHFVIGCTMEIVNVTVESENRILELRSLCFPREQELYKKDNNISLRGAPEKPKLFPSIKDREPGHHCKLLTN